MAERFSLSHSTANSIFSVSSALQSLVSTLASPEPPGAEPPPDGPSFMCEQSPPPALLAGLLILDPGARIARDGGDEQTERRQRERE